MKLLQRLLVVVTLLFALATPAFCQDDSNEKGIDWSELIQENFKGFLFNFDSQSEDQQGTLIYYYFDEELYKKHWNEIKLNNNVLTAIKKVTTNTIEGCDSDFYKHITYLREESEGRGIANEYLTKCRNVDFIRNAPEMKWVDFYDDILSESVKNSKDSTYVLITKYKNYESVLGSEEILLEAIEECIKEPNNHVNLITEFKHYSFLKNAKDIRKRFIELCFEKKIPSTIASGLLEIEEEEERDQVLINRVANAMFMQEPSEFSNYIGLFKNVPGFERMLRMVLNNPHYSRGTVHNFGNYSGLIPDAEVYLEKAMKNIESTVAPANSANSKSIKGNPSIMKVYLEKFIEYPQYLDEDNGFTFEDLLNAAQGTDKDVVLLVKKLFENKYSYERDDGLTINLSAQHFWPFLGDILLGTLSIEQVKDIFVNQQQFPYAINALIRKERIGKRAILSNFIFGANDLISSFDGILSPDEKEKTVGSKEVEEAESEPLTEEEIEQQKREKEEEKELLKRDAEKSKATLESYNASVLLHVIALSQVKAKKDNIDYLYKLYLAKVKDGKEDEKALAESLSPVALLGWLNFCSSAGKLENALSVLGPESLDALANELVKPNYKNISGDKEDMIENLETRAKLLGVSVKLDQLVDKHLKALELGKSDWERSFEAGIRSKLKLPKTSVVSRKK